MSEALLHDAWRKQQAGQIPEAARLYADILRKDPRNIDALFRLGTIYLEHGRFADADHLFAAAIKIGPNIAELFYNRGCALMGLEQHADALAAFVRALSLKPDLTEARNNRGLALMALRRHREALACFDKVAAERPDLPMVHGNRAHALIALGEPEQAVAACDIALAANPLAANVLFHRGAALSALGRLDESLAQFDAAIAASPDHADALSYRGIVLALLGRHEDAIASYDRAHALNPADIGILHNRGTSLAALKRFEEAIRDRETVLAADPGFKYARGNLLHSRLHICDWRTLEEEKTAIVAALHAGLPVLHPLQSIAISDTPDELRQCAHIWVAQEWPPAAVPLWRGERYDHERIRIAYVSADFCTHPVATLAAGVFEHHDRNRFETLAVSLGPDDGSTMRQRLSRAFDRFIDGRGQSDAAIAALLHDAQVDIAVDMMGFTENARTGIFARRPAGLQVNYLGFPGTMGAPYIDYIIADPSVVPSTQRTHYDEKLVHLPDTYLPNDAKRAIAAAAPSRAEAGLPAEGFVFCAFNSPYKINPDMFGIWMRLLTQAEGSVLWLSQATPPAIRNLKREAEARRVDAERLIFAPFVAAPEDHLARLGLADLFLDTAPYNAHATACDALWAGIPLVTLAGSTLASRVGASVLSAIGLPELVAYSSAEYEAIALGLARDAAARDAIKKKLARNRTHQPLFDTARYTKNLEAAYETMWRRHQKGEAPQDFAVSPHPP